MPVPAALSRCVLPILGPQEISSLQPQLADVIEYRKSGISLNWIIGCPLDCGYCVRHLFDNFGMKAPKRLMSDEDAVQRLTGHPWFRPHQTPIQLLNRATDPMLPQVKPHVFNVLQQLDDRGLTNHVLIITRWRVTPEDCAALNSFTHLRLTVLVTHSNIQDVRIEPVDSTIAATSLRTLYQHAQRYRTILYWRPIVPGLNDTEAHLQQAHHLSRHAHATVFTGLFYKNEIAAYYKAHGLAAPYRDTARRKIMPEVAEDRILQHFGTTDPTAPYGTLFRKTSCGVAFAHGEADYNGHIGVPELCDICPDTQVALCRSARTTPDAAEVETRARALGATGPIDITERAIIVEGLDERPRNYLQQLFAYQCNDRAKPHLYRQHGRAPLGWPAQNGTPAP
ncbi:radical SAM protein [Streptomyces aureocirculatus]|uniref:radical SAM protein n=1 Tax=Streptomyces aureocirculatus TaxID=67275 RepID=UPI0004CB5126|nr:radical SAM protein [Streptomyces aureocirculatus]